MVVGGFKVAQYSFQHLYLESWIFLSDSYLKEPEYLHEESQGFCHFLFHQFLRVDGFGC